MKVSPTVIFYLKNGESLIIHEIITGHVIVQEQSKLSIEVNIFLINTLLFLIYKLHVTNFKENM